MFGRMIGRRSGEVAPRATPPEETRKRAGVGAGAKAETGARVRTEALPRPKEQEQQPEQEQSLASVADGRDARRRLVQTRTRRAVTAARLDTCGGCAALPAVERRPSLYVSVAPGNAGTLRRSAPRRMRSVGTAARRGM